MATSRTIAKGTLRSVSSDVVTYFPQAPTAYHPTPPSMRSLGVTVIGTKEDVERFRWEADRAKEHAYERDLYAEENRVWTAFGTYLSAIMSLCLGYPRPQCTGSDPVSVLRSLRAQKPGWANFVPRTAKLANDPHGPSFLNDMNALARDIDAFLHDNYRALPPPPEIPEIRTLFRWGARRKARERWSAYEKYLAGVAAFLEPPLTLDGALSLSEQHARLAERIESLAGYAATIEAIAADDESHLSKDRKHTRQELLAHLASTGPRLSLVLTALHKHLRERAAATQL